MATVTITPRQANEVAIATKAEYPQFASRFARMSVKAVEEGTMVELTKESEIAAWKLYGANK
jgi:hypothetical protein